MPGSSAYCAYLERVQLETLGELEEFVHPDVRFKDPFNDVQGIEAMRAILAEMFELIPGITFTIHRRVGTEPEIVIIWTLKGRLRGKPWSVDGSSYLTFDEQGLLTSHIDYWDAASGLYEHFPLIGWPLKAMRRRLQHRPSS